MPSIDVSFDTEFADRLARYETYNKHNYRPNTYLHKWWGRRCGSTFRLILKGLVDDPARASYYTPLGLEGKIILDPMMGGGTTLHEALRLGASVMGVDIDPIPVLQARASLTDRPTAVLQAGFERFYDCLAGSLGDLFMTHCPECGIATPLWYTLYGLRRRCSCGDVLVVDSLTIRHEANRAIRLCPRCGVVDFPEHDCHPNGLRLVEKGQATCDGCGGRYEDLTERPYFARYEMLLIAGHCAEHGLFYRSPDAADRRLRQCADERRAALALPVGDFDVVPGDKSVLLLGRGVRNYLDLFSSRQLIFLQEVIRHLPDDDPIVRLNLALLVSTSLEFNSMLCGYKGAGQRRAGAVRHAFAHHGYAFPYTALETNPIYPRRASGTLRKLFHSRIERARAWAAAPLERDLSLGRARFVPIAGERDGGEEVDSAAALSGGARRFFLMQGSATALPAQTGSIDAVVTDPPYYDSIQYGDLAAFFRVWLRQFVPDAADWEYDLTTAAVSSGRGTAADPYVRLLTGIFRECRRVLRPETGRLIFTFHHWQPRAWAALTTTLYEAGFTLLNHYIVHAEHPMSVHINNVRALTHDAILVLAAGRPGHDSKWRRPAAPAREDSYHFTQRCATLLGWMLDQAGLTREEIESGWREL
jgi:putative DNA methylase